jgi:hypothetical protein
MTEKPTVRTAEPESQPHSSEGSSPPAATAKRSRRKKILVPAVLTVIGLAILLAGFLMYPRRGEPAPPINASVTISGSATMPPIWFIYYTVDQVRPDVASVTVRLLPSVSRVAPGARATVILDAGGAAIMNCSPSCHPAFGSAAAVVKFGSRTATAPTPTAHFLVKAHSFGVTANGVTAAAAFPDITFSGVHQQPLLMMDYQIPAANTYDWSANPTIGLSKSHATWEEPVIPSNQQQRLGAGGLTPTRVATGINHTAETNDNTLTLVAGVLFGLGGGALVAAVQEALHD